MPNQQYPKLHGLGGYNSQQVKAFARFFQMEDLDPKQFYDRRPDAAPNPTDYIKTMKAELTPLIVPDAFAGKLGISLLQQMSIEQLEKIGMGNDPILKLAILNTFNRLLKSAEKKDDPQIDKMRLYLIYSPAWQF